MVFCIHGAMVALGSGLRQSNPPLRRAVGTLGRRDGAQCAAAHRHCVQKYHNSPAAQRHCAPARRHFSRAQQPCAAPHSLYRHPSDFVDVLVIRCPVFVKRCASKQDGRGGGHEFRNPRSRFQNLANGGTQRTISPLTPALSPLRGEGVAVDVQRDMGASCRVCFLPGCAASISKTPRTRSKNIVRHKTACRAPSPLNGERAGVRGESMPDAEHVAGFENGSEFVLIREIRVSPHLFLSVCIHG